MSPFENILGSLHDLSYEEKLKLRVVLEEELKSQNSDQSNTPRKKSALIGMFSDEPELMDQVMEAVYERRSRPLRLSDEQPR